MPQPLTHAQQTLLRLLLRGHVYPCTHALAYGRAKACICGAEPHAPLGTLLFRGWQGGQDGQGSMLGSDDNVDRDL